MRSRWFVALMLCAVAACSHHAAERSAAAKPIFPPGIIVHDWENPLKIGIYPADEAGQCCFLAGKSTFTLDNPVGTQTAVFTYYVPNLPPFEHTKEIVTVLFDGVKAGPPTVLNSGLQDVSYQLPASLQQKSNIKASLAMATAFVPAKIGLNGDRRELSVMLMRVGFIAKN